MGLLARINPLQYRWGRQAKRGGSWNNNPRNCRSAYRNNNNPDNRNNNIGFRVARSAPSTLQYQNRQVGICRARCRRVQTYSGDVGNSIRKSTESG
ncbi:SUMF1/EgtB/PvdO family nonheme iron enzyme [Lusitaniella coriacea]